jgi:mannose-1-phosphate guanylyltransferase
MKALLLAAGFGTRLRPLTDSLPKCLVAVGGKPLLERWFDLLFSSGIESALVNTHYLAEQVVGFVAASPEKNKITLSYENELLGTGGTILANKDYFAGEPFLLIHADNLTVFDVRAFVQVHRDRPGQAAMTMMTFRTDVPESCGIVELDDKGIVVGFFEKVKNPPGNLANAAVYILESEVVDFIASLGKREVDFSTEVIPHFVGRIAAWHNGDYHRDIGTLEGLASAELEFSARAAKN